MSATASVRSRRCVVMALATFAGLAAIAALTLGQADSRSWLAGFKAYDHAARWLELWMIVFAAAVVSSIVGFAFSAIAGAMMMHMVSAGVEAVQIMMVASIGIQMYTVAALYRSIQWSRCMPFIAGGLVALPIGVVLLLALRPHTYLLLMGGALIVYGLYMQFRRSAVLIPGERRLSELAIGALGGITGALAAFPGACIVIWCGMRGWDKLAQRAVYQPYILVMQIAGIVLISIEQPASIDPTLLAYALPGLAGAVIGVRVFRSLSDAHFHRMINAALIASGVALVLK